MIPNKYGNPIEDRHPEIVYCKTHSAAFELREALEEISKDTQRYESRASDTATYEPSKMALIAQKALAAAKGEK